MVTDVTDEPFRVIVVEDDEDVALYVQTILHRRLPCEVKVLASADGYEALESEFDPDVVITDLELPGRGGFELLGDIRARRSDLAVVIMTAHAGGEYAERARREGANDYLAKPLSSKDLVAIVERLARGRRERPAVE
ncbi:MAG: response regulator [Microbacterium sp.]|nr:response regulator [Microbacterium sp.]MAM55264.1 response regulator [Microbacterium sp.]MAY50282.1 response regulator [Microbacterium sp.]HAS33389.1 response regulator [Microbacterium sp.]HBR87745.1 response regulator [Microbacterium sp.]